MKSLRLPLICMSIVFGGVLLMSCSSDDNADKGEDDPEVSGDCFVHLFDGDNFDENDDHVIIDEPGEYSDLSDLPNAEEKDWTDEADSFIVGDSTTVTAWTETNFEGDSTVYEGGEYASVDEPYSMKIICGAQENDNDEGGNGNEGDNGDKTGDYTVTLFDGDEFTDDSLVVEGPGEFEDLDDLPNSDGNSWTDEADSFKVSENTKVTVWTETNFEGDSTTYDEDQSSVDEPYSMKIKKDD